MSPRPDVRYTNASWSTLHCINGHTMISENIWIWLLMQQIKIDLLKIDFAHIYSSASCSIWWSVHNSQVSMTKNSVRFFIQQARYSIEFWTSPFSHFPSYFLSAYNMNNTSCSARISLFFTASIQVFIHICAKRISSNNLSH